MKVSDYIVNFYAKKGITDVFGYPGGMVTHLMDSFFHYKDLINSHINYHEQAAAFSACGYAQISLKPGIAYATSGPGATNLITGICNAYFDSIPTIFITGQVNTFESRGKLGVRQKGFQETDIVGITKNVTKYSQYVASEKDIRYCLEKAWHLATTGRPGPVLLDIPMNIQRADVNPSALTSYTPEEVSGPDWKDQLTSLYRLLLSCKRPCLILGAGLKISGSTALCRRLVQLLKIPVVTSMPAIDILGTDDKYLYGFLGAYGNRQANFIAAKSDLVIALGSRLDVRQIGASPQYFASEAALVRVDIDSGEFTNQIKDDEIQIQADLKHFIIQLIDDLETGKLRTPDIAPWRDVCDIIKEKLAGFDVSEPNHLIQLLSDVIPDNTIITTDVGQNQVWVAQSFHVKKNQTILFSAGHGAMGYSLPSAIGAFYAKPGMIISFNGDGGIQMNLQELQFISREKLPIKIIVLNNCALGMIRHFQEMYFDSRFNQTVPEHGYTPPDFSRIAVAFDLGYRRIEKEADISNDLFSDRAPCIIELVLPFSTYVYPKLEFGKPNQDQEPLLDRDLYQFLMDL